MTDAATTAFYRSPAFIQREYRRQADRTAQRAADCCRAQQRAEALAVLAARQLVDAGANLPALEQDVLVAITDRLMDGDKVPHLYPDYAVPSSIVSRFRRAGLPSPAYIRRTARLAIASVLLAEGFTVTAVALALDCSSVGAFRRTMRQVMGMNPSELARHPRTAPLAEQLAELAHAIAHGEARPTHRRRTAPAPLIPSVPAPVAAERVA